MREQYEKQFERFSQEIAEHTVTILRNDGLYRHLRCRRGDSYTLGFDVITWPGYLAYVGDMGSYVFSRLPDMFEFFRGRRTAMVDRGYLAEKAVAADKPDGIQRYSEGMFRAAVKADFDAFVESDGLSSDEAADLWEQISDDVLSCAEMGHSAALDAATNFRWVPEHLGATYPRAVFTDFWEHSLEDYTARFWWCCYAVPWAIEAFDRQVAATAPTEQVTG